MDVHHWHNVKLHFPKPNKPIRYLNVTVSWKDLHMSSLHVNNMYLFSVSTFLLDIAFGIEVSYRFFFSIYSFLFQASGQIRTVYNYLMSKWINLMKAWLLK